MVHLVNHLGRQVQPDLARLGLSSRLYLLLGQVFAAPGSSGAALGRATGLSSQLVAQLLDQAEDRGWVERRQRGRGRPASVTLTRAGVVKLEEGWPVVHGVGDDLLSPQQHRQLQNLLDLLRPREAETDDVVVLVDAAGRDAGTAPRLSVHTTDTPRHRAFSTYLRDDRGRVLITRRALHKTTWAGVWTNAACGHTRPGETPEEAAARRVPQELGAAPLNLRMVLPDFAYRAVDASGIVENELCPVMVGEVDADALAPWDAEVCDHAWVSWQHLRRVASETPMLLSPWSVLQIAELGEDPWGSR